MKNVEDLYPLSPLQQGMLFHTLHAPMSGIYIEQTSCTLHGDLNREAFKHAWQHVVDRHPVFRTAFLWEGLDEPVQIVRQHVDLPWEEHDWRGQPPDEQGSRLDALLQADQVRGFVMTSAPLTRFILIRTAEDASYFVWTHHHILLDGWSLSLVLDEVFSCYLAFATGQAPLLAHPRPYRDYIAWLQRQDHAQAEAFWRQTLRGLTAPTPLGIDLPLAPAAPPATAAVQEQRLAPAATAALDHFVRQHSLTLNTLVQGAWALLLSRYSAEDDVLFGVTVAGRPPDLPGSATMVGLFINTLPLRVQLPPHAPVCSWLAQLQTQQVELRQYEYSALVQVQGWSEVPRRLPLFESLLVFENYPVGEEVAAQTSRPRLAVTDLRSAEQTNYPLTLAVAPSSELLLQISYDSRRFRTGAITRLLGHLETLLAAMVAAPQARLADLSLLTASERQQVLEEWNATAAPFPHDQGLHQLVAAQAERVPDAVALVFDRPPTTDHRPTTNDQRPTTNDQRPTTSGLPLHPFTPSPLQHLTYHELQERALRLAQQLHTMRVGPDALVALCLERSLDLVVAILGVLNAGAAFLPLDPAYPPARLAFLLQDAQPALLLTQRALLPALPPLTLPFICLDQDAPPLLPTPRFALPDLHADQLAYVLYTSGSTGTPKGVMVSQRAIVNRLCWMQATYRLAAHDRVLQKTPYSFDVSLWEFFWPLICGAQLVLARPGGQHDPAYLLALIEATLITTLHFVPPMLQAFLQQPDLARCRSLRRVISSGEALPLALQADFFAHLASTQLHNLYGPTEAAVDVSAWACELADGERLVPIGRPVANTQLYVLDRELQPVPLGVAGELYIGGVQLARGYHRRPDLTAERFVPNPFGEVVGVGCWVTGDESSNTQHPTPNTRLYKTGDLARYREDGVLEFVGRIDEQLKVRGFRIEPGEIEAALRQHPSVRESVVVAREEALGEKRLVAYVVMRTEGRGLSGADSSVLSPQSSVLSELRDFLKERLPDYMLPAAFMVLDAIPLTPSGKLDRRALPAPGLARPLLEAAFSAARTPEEELLAAIWAAVLRLDRVGIHDNFFDLGGHSLLATQVISRLRETFKIELALRDLFDAPTVAGLAARLLIVQRSTPDQTLPPLQPVSRNRPPPLSFAQQRLWFLDQLEPNSSVYNIPSTMHLSGLLDLDALRRSLSEIVRRHESLRTTFAMEDGQPVQVIAPPHSIPLPLIDLQSLPQDERGAAVVRLATIEDKQHFDLVRGPLLRFKLLRLSEKEHVTLLTMHHIISDGWSLGVFIQELTTIYTAFAAGQSSPLPELFIQYADFAIWQREWLQGMVLERHLTYWRQQLADLSALDLPTDRPRPASPTFEGAAYELTLSKKLRDELVLLSRQEGVTLFMTLLAAFQVLLSRYSNQDDIAVGTPIAGRSWAETEGLIGCFVNTLVLRTSVSGNLTVRQLLREVREVCLGAYSHQDLPFEQVVEALQPARDLSRHPLFQVMFSLQNAPAGAVELTDLALRPLMVERRTTQFDMSLFVEEAAEGLIGALEYSTDLFVTGTISRMLGHLETLLAAMVATPQARLADLSLLTASERQQVLEEWNATAAPFPHDQGLHQLVAAQAARSPDAVALVFDGPPTNDHRPTTNDQRPTTSGSPLHPFTPSPLQHLTYHELQERALRLAQQLHTMRVGPDTLVALCLERSLDLVVALLGVLNAGAAFLPLDPAYPPARLAFLLQDAQPALLLTQRALLPALPPLTLPHICLDQDAPPLFPAPHPAPLPDLHADQLAYVLYTSGSTGTPKGVMVSQRAIVNRLCWMQATYRLAAHDRVLQKTPYSFDVSLWEFFWPLICGAQLVLARPGGQHDPAYLLALIEATLITTLHFVPPMLQAFLQQPDLARCRSLRRVISSGEALPLALQADFFAHLASTQLHNLYGPTEAAVDVSAWACELADGERLVPIGRPVANTQLYVLDRELQPVPLGVAGELYIGGVQLARGYHRRPDLTAERFVPNPFGEVVGVGCWVTGDESSNTQHPTPNTRLYKTGDLARYREDGVLEFVGRIDEQLKVRGFRIEPGEIEAALRQHPSVRESVVVAREEALGEKRLVAYVVMRTEGRGLSGADSSVLSPQSSVLSELRDFLKERLPEYMIPSAFMALSALPLTPSGKLDRRALPAPEPARPLLEAGFSAARTPEEELLAAIWAAVLRLDRVGIHDNFFALGGDSILSLQIIAQARQAGLYLTPKQLFQYQTIAELAAVAGTAPTVVAPQQPVSGPVPLTPIQQYFFGQALPAPQHYNQALLLTLRQLLVPALLHRALAQLLLHHDALRLRFVQTTQGWQQHCAPSAPHPSLTLCALGALPPAAQAAAIEQFAAAVQTSLDLTHGPLLRAVLFDRGPDQPARLLLVIHHLAVDGVSWRVLLEDLATAYSQLAAGSPLLLPPKTSAFAQWAEHLVAYAQSGELRAEATYWRAVVRQRRPLPRDHPEGRARVGSVAQVAGQLDREETRALLMAVPAAYHTQINDALLSALVQAVGSWSGEARLLVELEGHGREDLFADIDLSRTVGWFTTLYPVLLDVRAARDVGAALQAVKEQLRQVPQRGIGYGVLRYLATEGELRAELAGGCEVSFNYLGQVDAVAGTTGGMFGGAPEGSGADQDPRGPRSHVLEVSGVVVGEQLELELRYSPELHRHSTIERLMAAYLAALRALIAHCLAPDVGGFTPSDFPLAQLDQDDLDAAFEQITFTEE